MLTEGLNIEATGSWDSQSLYGESATPCRPSTWHASATRKAS